MWSSDRRHLLAALALLPLGGALAGCGFQPMYGEGAPARAIFGRVSVDVVPSAAGYILRERLIEQLGAADMPTHRLEVTLDIETEGVALSTQNVTTRFDVTGEAGFRLVPIGGDAAVLADDVRAIAGFSAPESETASAFASRVAEQDAIRRVARQLADRIVQQLALTAGDWAVAGPRDAPETAG